MKKAFVLLILCTIFACGSPPINTTDIDNFYIQGDYVDAGGNEMRSRELGAVVDGWSQSGQMVAGNTGQIVGLQVDFSQGPGASSYTVQFNLLNNAPGVQAVALITWTVAGNFVTRRVTVGNGVSVTGTGQAVQVRVIDNSLVASAGSKYNVSILVAPGVRGSSAEPPTLVVSDPIVGYAIPVAPGASHDFPVPLDAGVTQVYITVQGALDAGGVTLGTSEAQERGGGLPFKSWDPGQTFFWVPVAPGTDTIRVTTGATAVSTYAFTCTLGIDG